MTATCFYPLTPNLAATLREHLTAAEWRLWSFFATLVPFGDRQARLPKTSEILRECGISRATYYRALAKFEALGLFEVRDLGVGIRNCQGARQILNAASEGDSEPAPAVTEADSTEAAAGGPEPNQQSQAETAAGNQRQSHTCDSRFTDEKGVSHMRQPSHTCDSQTPDSPPTGGPANGSDLDQTPLDRTDPLSARARARETEREKSARANQGDRYAEAVGDSDATSQQQPAQSDSTAPNTIPDEKSHAPASDQNSASQREREKEANRQYFDRQSEPVKQAILDTGLLQLQNLPRMPALPHEWCRCNAQSIESTQEFWDFLERRLQERMQGDSSE